MDFIGLIVFNNYSTKVFGIIALGEDEALEKLEEEVSAFDKDLINNYGIVDIDDIDEI